MCETPKDKVVEKPEKSKEPRRSYYYDDSHGYEDFDPEDDESDDASDEDLA